MKNSRLKIPVYVSKWTDKYFHQSAFDAPWNFPSQKVIKFLSKFKQNKKIKLFRGINEFNKESFEIESWTYDRKIAKNYIQEGGKIIECEFSPEKILLDATLLNREQKILLGYDYEVDDKEVLVYNK